MNDGHSYGKAGAWAFRWLLPDLYPGRYLVTVECPGFYQSNFAAVVDDFGNLVRVPR